MAQQSKYDDPYPLIPKKDNASVNPPPLDPNKTKIKANKDPKRKCIPLAGHKRSSSILDTIQEEDK